MRGNQQTKQVATHINQHTCHVEVIYLWRCCDILEYSTLTLRARVQISTITMRLLSFRQGNLSTLLLLTQGYKWGPGSM